MKIDHKFFISGILIFIVIGGAVYLLLPRKSKSNVTSQLPTTSITPQTVNKDIPIPQRTNPQSIVVINKNGFSPQVLTISKGTQVIWTNKSSNEVSINSNPHPAHSDYPLLNIGVISQSKSKSLIFNKPGKYGYHNHFDSTQTGIIIVN